MFTKERLDSWNELFPEAKIRETDLSHPSELFLTRAFVSYLRHFGYVVQPPYPLVDGHVVEPSLEKVRFMMKIVKQIDHILKINTNKSYAYTYCDLIKPTPKKTSRVLEILLNYMYYYHMYKAEVFDAANTIIKEHQELKQAIESIEQDNECRRQRAAQIKEEIISLQSEIPAMQADLEASRKRCSDLQNEFRQLQELNNELDVKIQELQEKNDKLKMYIVLDNEPKEYHSQIRQLQEEIKEQLARKSDFEAKSKDHKQQIEKYQIVLDELKKDRDILPGKLLEDYRQRRKKLRELQLLESNLQNQRDMILHEISKREEALQSMEESMQRMHEKWEREKAQKVKAIEEICDKSLECQVEQLERVVQAQAETLAEQMELNTYLVHHLAILFEENPQ